MQWDGCKLHQNLDDKPLLYIKEGHFIKIKLRNENTNKEIIEMSNHVFDIFAPNPNLAAQCAARILNVC